MQSVDTDCKLEHGNAFQCHGSASQKLSCLCPFVLWVFYTLVCVFKVSQSLGAEVLSQILIGAGRAKIL